MRTDIKQAPEKKNSKEKDSRKSLNKVAYLALCLALAMLFSYVESLFPLSLGIPGIKMGLPNIIVVFLIYRAGIKEAASVSISRIFLSALLFGNLFSFLYSLAGALLSLLVMILLKKSGAFRVVTVSISGAVSHNLGQILVAMLILGFKEILYYLPYLILSGILAGIVIGILAALFIHRFRHIFEV